MTIEIPIWFLWIVFIGFWGLILFIGLWFFGMYGATKGWWDWRK